MSLLLSLVAKWNVPPEQGLEPRDLTKVIENEQKTKYAWNQEEQEKIKQQEFFPLPNKQKLPRNTENIYERRKKYSVIHPHLNKQLNNAKQESELLQENVAHSYSHNVEIIAESESDFGSRFAEGSGVIESTTETYTKPEGSGDIDTTRDTVTIIFTTPEGSGEGPGDLKTPSTATDIFTTRSVGLTTRKQYVFMFLCLYYQTVRHQKTKNSEVDAPRVL